MTENTVKSEIDALQADLKKLRDDVVGLTRAIAELTAATIPQGLEAAQAAGGRIAETLHKATADAKTAGTAGVAALEEKIAERPITAIVAAFGVGLLLGKLTDRN